MRTRRTAALISSITACSLSVPAVAATAAARLGHDNSRHKAHFDLQAHRGGIGERTESSIASFSHALEVGVSSLELDTQITKDRKVVVTHDRRTNSVTGQG